MSEVLNLAAENRENLGKGASRALRKKGMIPAVVYGAGKKTISIAIAEKEITKYYRKPQYISQVIEFELDGKKFKVLPKAIDLHPITEMVRHADFVFLEDKFQKMEVPVVYKNKENCIGVKRGGYFNIIKRTLLALCPVDNLPRKIEIDVTNIPIGASIKAKNVSIPEGSNLLIDPEFVIASIIGKKGKSSDSEETASEVKTEAKPKPKAAKSK